MLSTLFVISVSLIPLLFDQMNLLKNSFFSSSNRRKSKTTTRNQLKNYAFRQANNSAIDPLLYTFENNDIELDSMDSDEEQQSNSNEDPVRARHVRSTFTPAAHGGGSIVIVEKPVLPDETIQAFAIRHRVPVSQLKRINNLQNDQDFYALSCCRVPVRRFGLLHESLPSTIVDLNDQSQISLPVTHLSQQNHHAFLNAMDHDLALMRTKVEQLIETPSTTLIPQSAGIDHGKSRVITTNDLKCDGADCGCRLWHIVLIVILIVLLPLICAYFYIKSQKK